MSKCWAPPEVQACGSLKNLVELEHASQTSGGLFGFLLLLSLRPHPCTHKSAPQPRNTSHAFGLCLCKAGWAWLLFSSPSPPWETPDPCRATAGIPSVSLGIPSTLCRLNHPLASHPSSCWEWRWEAALTVSSVLLNPTRRYVVFPFWIWEINYLFCLWALVKVSRLVKFYLIPCYTCSLNKST